MTDITILTNVMTYIMIKCYKSCVIDSIVYESWIYQKRIFLFLSSNLKNISLIECILIQNDKKKLYYFYVYSKYLYTRLTHS